MIVDVVHPLSPFDVLSPLHPFDIWNPLYSFDVIDVRFEANLLGLAHLDVRIVLDVGLPYDFALYAEFLVFSFSMSIFCAHSPRCQRVLSLSKRIVDEDYDAMSQTK